ncbi:MAG: M28 family peptidase [Bacteroidia bacterium]
MLNKIRIGATALLFVFAFQSAHAQKPNKKEKRLAHSVEKHIVYLASDDLGGRSSGSEGEQLSAQYIKNQFEKIGLEPKGEKGYYQNLDITTLRIAQANTSLMMGDKVYTLFQDFFPLSISADNGDYRGMAINVQSGITDENLSWDDYEHADVTGKAVIIKMETPEADNPHSKFAGWSGIERRVELAKEKGATAVIFYTTDADHQPTGELKKIAKSAELPVIFVKRDLSTQISPIIDLTVSIMSLKSIASNVIGFIDHGASNTVVIGAHHDHLGRGENGGSREEKLGGIHNGADDNASGIAGLIELAIIIKENPKMFSNNNYLFIAFTAEELGLLGSKHFVAHPTIPINTINYMVNMDMIGKLDSTKKTLVINGVGTSPSWKRALKEVKYNDKKIARISTTESGIGSSDHSPFYLADMPAVHFFTGQHEHYHKTTDDVEIVNYTGEAYVIHYICSWLEFMDDQGKVKFTKTKDESQGRMKFKVTLGVMPDYVYDGEGMRIDGVKEGKPASNAGILKGDIVTSMNGKPILGMQDYMKVLMELNPGDTIPVQIKRGEEFLEIEVTF